MIPPMGKTGLASFLLLSTLAAPQEEIREVKELLWPRHLEQGGDKVVVYDPQIDSWEKHETVHARQAVVVTASGANEEAFGVYERHEESPAERCPILEPGRDAADPAVHSESRRRGEGRSRGAALGVCSGATT